MRSEGLHVSDQELLLAADGEFPSRRAAEVRSHLAACWDCRARMAEIEGAIVDFARSHRQTLDPMLPAVDGPRARLRAELAALTAESNANSWQRIFWSTSVVRAAAYVSFGLFAIVLAAKLLVQHSTQYEPNSAVIPFERGAGPDHGLTPGATRRATIRDVCSMAHEDVVREVPTSLRQKVFQEYGIANARADDYEIDYLIAPGLGGVEDIHNLWPEPYTSSMWNARVKDALEEHLHQLVCAGKVNLSTAQNDIATDWIAAYKKYFHTDRPLSLGSWLDSVTLLRSPRA
jgi:anti-sigma factor RsiW